jgi:hypothetical protein
MTSFVKERFEIICTQATAEKDQDRIVVTSAKPEGDGQIILTRGKKRHVYDFKVALDVEATIASSDSSAESKTKKFKAILTFAELSPISDFESTISFKKSVAPELKSRVDDLVGMLRSDLIEKFLVHFFY